MASRTTGRASGATRKPLISETVSFGNNLSGRINQTARGFELFDGQDKYLCTEPTIQAARKTLYQRVVGGSVPA